MMVAEQRASLVTIMDSTGKVLRQFGRPGEGPGDLGRPCCIAFHDDTAWVLEPGNARISRFVLADSAGTFLSHTPVVAGSSEHDRIAAGPDNGVYALFLRGTPNGSQMWVRRLFDSAGTPRSSDTFPVFPQESLHVARLSIGLGTGERGEIGVGQPFGPMALAALGPGGVVALSLSSSYRISIYRPGTGIPTVIKGSGNGPSLSRAEREEGEQQLRSAARDAGVGVSALPFGVPDHKAPIEDLGFDEDGNLWVVRSRAEGEDSRADVYDSAGTWVAIADWPRGVTLPYFAVRRWTGLGVRTDSLGAREIVRLVFHPAH
jgi:hypothetical protein